MRQLSKEDFERNIYNIKNNLELDASIVELKNYLYQKHKKKVDLLKYFPIFKVKVMKPKNCVHCGKEFKGYGCKIICSAKCKRKRLNKNYLAWFKKRMETDWQFALKTRLRDNLRDAIRYYNQTGKLRKHINSGKYINYAEVIEHLGPCPGNRREWHIDHIKPLIAFDFSNTSEIKKAFAKENLRWIPARENLMKAIRYKVAIS